MASSRWGHRAPGSPGAGTGRGETAGERRGGIGGLLASSSAFEGVEFGLVPGKDVSTLDAGRRHLAGGLAAHLWEQRRSREWGSPGLPLSAVWPQVGHSPSRPVCVWEVGVQRGSVGFDGTLLQGVHVTPGLSGALAEPQGRRPPAGRAGPGRRDGRASGAGRGSRTWGLGGGLRWAAPAQLVAAVGPSGPLPAPGHAHAHVPSEDQGHRPACACWILLPGRRIVKKFSR